MKNPGRTFCLVREVLMPVWEKDRLTLQRETSRALPIIASSSKFLQLPASHPNFITLPPSHHDINNKTKEKTSKHTRKNSIHNCPRHAIRRCVPRQPQPQSPVDYPKEDQNTTIPYMEMRPRILLLRLHVPQMVQVSKGRLQKERNHDDGAEDGVGIVVKLRGFHVSGGTVLRGWQRRHTRSKILPIFIPVARPAIIRTHPTSWHPAWIQMACLDLTKRMRNAPRGKRTTKAMPMAMPCALARDGTLGRSAKMMLGFMVGGRGGLGEEMSVVVR